MSTPLFVAGIVGGTMLAVGAAGAIYRIVRGPSLLDRAIASDVLLVVLGAALVLDMAVRGHTQTIVLVMLAAMVGFVGSVTIARFVEDLRPEHGREPNDRVRAGEDTASAMKEEHRG
ncbi:monovalent cation/H+ antiporter complex subunit F [Micrococcus cohnii]|uniref:Multicomponent Na+:H+ antiporter subunit F n=1 Tax=Micrococcus cohnii TaxID=993416 RepID=A0A7W7GPN9_9MICC|nr:monovalent cation/H+ antiporter complex subunit F [Micrococcus cohnii]MBB4735911.1 multicomponent Na+:H+ antiporter subunit F [Micrococcus cohnii]